MLLRAPLVLLVLLATGACSKPYSGPVTVTPSETETVTAPLDAYIPVYAEISSGGSPAPMVLEHFELRCVDGTVCATRIVPGGRGGEGRIAGLRAGETDIVVTFQHPVTHVAGQARLHVRFVAGGAVSLAVGEPLPPATRADGMLVARDIPGLPDAKNVFSCHHDSAMPLRDRGAPYTRAVGEERFFACEPPSEIVPGQRHLVLSSRMQSRWNWGDHTMETVLVCASLRDGKIDGLRYYGTTASYRSTTLGVVGAVDDAACPVVP